MILLAPMIALHLVGMTHGQLSQKEKDEYKEAMKYKNNPKLADPKKNEYLQNGKAPRTCDDQCEVMKKSMTEHCGALAAKGKPAGVKPCKEHSDDMVKLCEDSCRDKGKIDGEYMKEHVKKPHAPPGRDGPRPSGIGGGSSDE